MSLNNQVRSATKWSAISEIAAKLVSPLSTMILARLLTPDAFGVLVTAIMVISFAEIFTDAGFQKYIIQKQFTSKDDLYKSTSVAFWSNFILSIAIWIVIIILSPLIAKLVGNEGYGLVVSVSCVCIPLAAFSSIQMAIFKRNFDFKTLFLVRIIGVLIPLLITIPLAFFTRSYWSLIIGMIALNISNAILLTLKSEWKPRWFYDLALFKKMFSFTSWSMFEAISIWLTGYLDIFIVGSILDTYYMGIYRTSMNTVASILAVITSATTPVLFSALSRLQDDKKEFEKMFFKFQKLVSLLVMPIGLFIFLFPDLVTRVLLGDQWGDAVEFIGIWGLISCIAIVLGHYCGEVFRAKGKPQFSVLAQWLYLIVLIPAVLISLHYDFRTLCYVRSYIRIEGMIVDLLLLNILVKISPLKMIKNILPSICGCTIVYSIIKMLPSCHSNLIEISYIVISASIYMLVVLLFKEDRMILLNLKQMIKR